MNGREVDIHQKGGKERDARDRKICPNQTSKAGLA